MPKRTALSRLEVYKADKESLQTMLRQANDELGNSRTMLAELELQCADLSDTNIRINEKLSVVTAHRDHAVEILKTVMFFFNE